MGVARRRLMLLFMVVYMSAVMYGIVWTLNAINPPLEHGDENLIDTTSNIEPSKDA